MERFRVDVVSAIRALKSAPVTAAAAVFTLALAVGVNLAMFGLIDRALLSPPAHVVDPGRVFTLGFEPAGDESRQARMITTSYVTFRTLQAQVPAASDVAAIQRVSTGTLIDSAQVQTEAMLVSGSYFGLIGVRPALGRTILPEDDSAPAGSAPAVLSHMFWRGTFGGDRNVLGRRVNIRGVAFTVAGVMPAGFTGHSSARVDVWIPFYAAMQSQPGWDSNPYRNFATIVMRLRPDETTATAAAQSGAAVNWRVTLSRIVGAEVSASESRIAYWLSGVSFLVLIIGLANTATLLLVRGAKRRRDLTIRMALGATRRRLLAQVVLESAILAAVSMGAALVLASWFDEAVRRVLLPSVIESTGLSLRVVAAASLVGLAALGLAAAVGTIQLPATLRGEIAINAGRGRRRTRMHAVLLVVQTTLSVVLLAGAALFGQSLYNLGTQDFGMNIGGVVLVEFERGSGPGQGDLFRSALEGIQSLPGVELATTVQMLPFTGFHVIPISVPGSSEPPSVNGQLPYLIGATPELMEILDIKMAQGRRFVAADDRGAPVVIVNESLARQAWPRESAIGKCLRIGFDASFDPAAAAGPPAPPASAPCREVIGVARDVRQRSVVPSGSEGRLMQYYVPFSQVPPPLQGAGPSPPISGLLLRASVGAEALAAPIRRLVMNGRTDLPFLQVRNYSELLERQMRPWRLGTMLLLLFGALALGVAAMGLYAAFAHSVVERRREIAIRIAVGAQPRGVRRMILREAACLAAVGALCGCAGSIIAGRWLQSMLFGIAPSDPVVLGSAALLMLIVALLATLVPARSASRTDPNSLLRTE